MRHDFSLDDLSAAQRRALMNALGGQVSAHECVLAALSRRKLIHRPRSGNGGYLTPLGRNIRAALRRAAERPPVGPVEPEAMDAVVDLYLAGKSPSAIAKRERLYEATVIEVLRYKRVYVEAVSA